MQPSCKMLYTRTHWPAGGTLTLSAGLYYSGSVELKSNVCLCLEPKQVLSNKPKPFEPGG